MIVARPPTSESAHRVWYRYQEEIGTDTKSRRTAFRPNQLNQLLKLPLTMAHSVRMACGRMRLRRLALGLFLFVAVDFGTPFLGGAFTFEA